MIPDTETLVDRLLVALAEVAQDLRAQERGLKDSGLAATAQSGVDIKRYADGQVIVECFVDVIEGRDKVGWWVDLIRETDGAWSLERRLLGHDENGNEIVLHRLPLVRLHDTASLVNCLRILIGETLALAPQW